MGGSLLLRFVAAATLTAGGVRAIVTVHVLTDGLQPVVCEPRELGPFRC